MQTPLMLETPKALPLIGDREEMVTMGNQQFVPVEDLAYMAGIIDGEGTICVRRQTNRQLMFHPTIDVVNTDWPLIEWCRELYRKLGVEPYVQERGRNRKICFCICVRRLKGVTTVLPHLIPYLKQKRYRAELLLDFCQRRLNATGGVRGRKAPYDSRDLELAALIYDANGDLGNNSTTVREAAHRLMRQSELSGN